MTDDEFDLRLNRAASRMIDRRNFNMKRRSTEEFHISPSLTLLEVVQECVLIIKHIYAHEVQVTYITPIKRIRAY